MSDELNKEPKDGSELNSTDLEQVTGGTEAVSLNFTKVQVVYKQQGSDSSGTSTGTPVGWDITANKAS